MAAPAAAEGDRAGAWTLVSRCRRRGDRGAQNPAPVRSAAAPRGEAPLSPRRARANASPREPSPAVRRRLPPAGTASRPEQAAAAVAALTRAQHAGSPLPPTFVCTHHTHWSRRGRTPYPVWTSMATYFYGHPSHAHEWPVLAASLGCSNVGGTPAIGLHPPHPLVASWTHALPGVRTSMATYCYGHPGTRTNGQCTRPGWDAEMLGGPPTVVCTHHTR